MFDTSILATLSEAAQNRQLSEATITAYRKTWIKLAAYAGSKDLSLESLDHRQVQDIYELLTKGRGASHHLQVKGAISFLYTRLGVANPFKECRGPRFDIDQTELKYLNAYQVGLLLDRLKAEGLRHGYYERLTFELAQSLFLTGQRFSEWAKLERHSLTLSQGRSMARIKGKGSKYSDVALPASLAASLRDWFEYLEAVKGVRVRGGSVAFGGSQFVFPGRDGKPISNSAFNARLKAACNELHIPEITAHGLRHTAATLLLNEYGRNIREVQELLRHKSIVTTSRYTHVVRERVGDMVDQLAAPR